MTDHQNQTLSFTYMDLASILHQIDSEITKLQHIREIVQGIASPARRAGSRKQRRIVTVTASVDPSTSAPEPDLSSPAPELIILPPKQKREYSRRLRPVPTAPRALGPAPSERPVFVPRASLATRVGQDREPAEVHSLEALVRQKLLGGIAPGDGAASY